MRYLWSPEIADDPRNFVRFVYPWGKANTPLAELDGPRNWQDALLLDIAEYIKSARTHQQIHKAVPAMYKAAVASGRGIGKSATFAWLSHWLVSTRLGASVWVTANGEPQLRDKTFPEISKWVAMAINSHWFDMAATKISPAAWFSEAVQRDEKINPKYWYIAAQLWSAENPDAFAGAHNVHGEMYLFDEASGIPTPIWDVAAGVFTEKIIDRYWLAFSNPRRNSGAFHECFHGEDRTAWRQWQIDASKVDVAQDALQAIIAKYGPDSDQARMEVYGQFPSTGDRQFISNEHVQRARNCEPIPDPGAPLLLGVDVGRHGKDPSVLAFRKGRDAVSIPWQTYRGLDTLQVAERVADAVTKYKVDAVFVDGNGVGGGTADNLKRWGYRVIEVQSGAGPNDQDAYTNKRVEIWALMKAWLETGSIPMSETLQKDLIGPEYSYHPVNNKLKLETKEEMVKRGIASPNEADALAMTFAQTVARNDTRTSRSHSRTRMATGVDYDPLASAR